jgi:hypothetical protein
MHDAHRSLHQSAQISDILQLANIAAATETLGSAKVCKSERTYHGEEDEALQAPQIATHRNTELIDKCNTKTNYTLVSLFVCCVSHPLSVFSSPLSLPPFLSSNLQKKTERRGGKKKEKKKRETVWTERVATRLSEDALVLRQQRSCTHPPNGAAPTTFSNEQTTNQARHETRNKERNKKKRKQTSPPTDACGWAGGDFNGLDLRT